MKDKNYFFSHDYSARNDPKLIQLQMEMGGLGLGIFWCLVEMLWENGGYIPNSYKTIAFNLRWASEDDVRKVVEDFDLFHNEGGMIWSDSAIRRIEQKEAVINTKREAGRKGGMAKAKQVEEDGPPKHMVVIDGSSPGVQQMLSGCLADAKLRKENIRKEKKSNSSSSRVHAREREKEEEQIFKIFFFNNLQNPDKEVTRFMNYYDGRGWKWGDQEIEDVEAVASQWTAETKGPRFPVEFLEWFRKVYDTAVDDGVSWNPIEMLHNVEKAKASVEGYDIRFWMRTKTGAYTVMNFVKSHELDKGLRIDYRYMT